MPHGGRVAEPARPYEPYRPERPGEGEQAPGATRGREHGIRLENLTYSEGRTEEALPWIKLRLPDDTSAHDYVKQEFVKQIKALSEATFDREQAAVISLFRDKASEEAFQQIPSENRKQVNQINASTFDAVFRRNRTATFLVLGHIENGVFVSRDSGDNVVGHIGVNELVRIAEKSGVTLIPIGCGSGEYAKAGVINDFYSVDAISRIGLALQRSRTFLELYENIASKTLQLVFDVSALSEIGRRLIITKRETTTEVGEIYIPAVHVPPSSTTSALLTTTTTGGGGGDGCSGPGCGCAAIFILVVILLNVYASEGKDQVPTFDKPEDMLKAIDALLKQGGLSKDKIKELESLRDAIVKGRSTHGR